MKIIKKGLVFLVMRTLAQPLTWVEECPEASPTVVIGGRDGDTEITTFSNAPVDGAFVIGGTTYSPSVSETNRGECVQGCGLVSAWSKEKNDWISRWVYVNTRGVLAITSNAETKRSVVLFTRYLQNTGEQ